MLKDLQKSVLVVDDSRLNCQMVAALLGGSYRVRLAAGGQEALDLLRREALPDLILLDVQMPGVDGYQVCADLKSNPGTRDIPVIFLTGQDGSCEEVRGFDCGAVDYITKPITPKVLLARVKTHLERASLYEEKNYLAELLRHMLLPKLSQDYLGLEIGHRFVPSKTLSGDFYDLIPIDQERLGVVMADVAGKGPDAAIQTVRAKYLIRALMSTGAQPQEILLSLNRELSSDPEARSITVFLAQIRPAQGHLTYANAGHEPGQLWHPSRSCWEELGATAMMLGASEVLEVEQRSLELEAGTTLLLMTDGVSEARSPQGDFIAMESLLPREPPREQPPWDLVNQVYQEAHDFSSGQFRDDLSLLALKMP